MRLRLQQVQWLFLDPSVLLNENETQREMRHNLRLALARRGRTVDQEAVERAWMQSITSPRPVHPLAGTAELLAPDTATAAAVVSEVIRTTKSVDTLYPGVQLALHTLEKAFKLGIIGAYRLPGVRSQLNRYHLHFPIVALGDELNLSNKLEIGTRPDPALFVWALRKAGCPASQAAFASDRVDLGLAPAKMAGMTTIWLRQTNHKLRHPRNSLETPDLTFNQLADLARYVEEGLS